MQFAINNSQYHPPGDASYAIKISAGLNPPLMIHKMSRDLAGERLNTDHCCLRRPFTRKGAAQGDNSFQWGLGTCGIRQSRAICDGS